MEEPNKIKILKKEVADKPMVNETLATYASECKPKKLVISTLAEQEQSNYLYWLSLTPSQRIANATELIRSVYADELRQPAKTKGIIFDKP